MFNRDEYFERIGFVPCDGEGMKDQLVRLHRCHSLAIPFEDLNSFCKTPVSLKTEDIFDKVIHKHRGGYCFELNNLFQQLLNCLGYDTYSIFCRPFSGEGVKLPLTHRMTAVTFPDELWLADVGLGGNGWVEPLVFRLDEEQTQFGRTFRIVANPDMGYLVELKRDDQFIPAVAFQLQAAEESDFEMSNYYTSSYPTSPFVNRMMCVLPTMDGRYTIRDNSFKIERNGTTEEMRLEADTFQDVLSQYFGIELPTNMREVIYHYLLEA